MVFAYPAGKTGRDHEVGDPTVAVASFEGAAALDDRDYATAQRLFAAIGRKDVAEAIKDALAALDRKDYATAQGLFEALGQKGAAAAQMKGSAPASPARPKPRHLKPLLPGTGLVLFAIFGVSAIYGSPLNWTFPTTKSQAIAGLSSAADVLKADLEAITGQSALEEERSAVRDLSAALTQLTVRLDQIEHERGARLDKVSERVDQDSSSRVADFAARLDKLEKKAALPATPASESADVVARLDKLEKRVAVAATPASEIAGLTTRLNKLEKRAAVAGASSAHPLPPAAPKQSSLMARAEPSAPNEIATSDNPGPLLGDYSVENVRDGIAVVNSRHGPQEVAPGDVIPGAGRVLRIEKRGGDWFVLTSRGVIASGPAPQ